MKRNTLHYISGGCFLIASILYFVNRNILLGVAFGILAISQIALGYFYKGGQ